ncbi:benzoate/H(+) symporter BenE family transporter [Alteromonas gilva]|uniref:Benzoate/H(+) symporter BenE family transporter n=1 Tax=Alteromonas gilva TaxID=2987522 RepID=A0ABT5L2A4_9ALTE|nr:benzoate/H(+) symporter BenE family transporter [Alteromonas gilva]MDC8829987.1 benzoate/H(+) symporter BenE family transporter [Alteromonas gilva]
MDNPLKLSHVAAGLTAVIVGYSSSVVIVIEAARQAGASEAQLISWLFVLGLAMGISCLYFSFKFRMPIITAWSTPGAVFLISTAGEFSLAEVTGAFIVAGLLSLLAARSKQLMRGIERIPPALSAAMLAGILLPYCLGVFSSAQEYPILALIFIAIYLLGSRWFARYLMLVLLVIAALAAVYLRPGESMPMQFSLPALEWVMPAFSLASAVSIGVPLFLITTLSQNLPGISIQHSHNYQPDNRFVLTGLALLQLLSAPFGGFMINLAAITAAICMADNVDEDPAKRYLAGAVAGGGYLLAGLFAVTITLLFLQMPAVVTSLLAGIALLSTLQSSLLRGFEDPPLRQSALLTLLCSASGLTLLGISAPVWGLLIGIITLWLHPHWQTPAANAKNSTPNQ